MPETTQQPWTIKRLLEWTQSYFEKAASDSPRLEAEILLAESLGCARIDLYTRFDEVPDAERLTQFRGWVKRRSAGEPVAYLVGYREFYSLRFKVDSNVLIPRPETEHVVVEALEAANKITEQPLRVIDIGTGSGCIAITLAKHLDDCIVAATDLSAAALAVARENATTHEVDNRVRFFEGDLLDALPAGSGQVHLIVSNPPYIGTDEIATVQPEVDQYEPRMALYSGPNGTELIAKLVTQSVPNLLPGGFLIFEAGPIIMDSCRRLIESTNGLQLVKVVKDYSGYERVVVAQRN